MTVKKTAKTPKRTYRASRFGIQNHFGEVWTSETFSTPKEAQEYLDKMRPIYGGLTKKHKVVPVRVAINIAAH